MTGVEWIPGRRLELRRLAGHALEKALEVQGPAVRSHLERARRRNPEASPRHVVRSLEKQYFASVVVMGGGAGATAALPAVGTAAGILVNLGEVGVFMEASALFCLAVAEAHGVKLEELERRRTLVLAVLLGRGGSQVVEKIAGRTGPYWAREMTKSISMSSINKINGILGPRFVTKYGTKQGVLVLGRELPVGIGAVIGAGGNAVFGTTTVAGVRRAFGPPPPHWPVTIGEG